MTQITSEQIDTACQAHYPEWNSFHQHEREAFRKQMRQTLQAYEAAKTPAATGGHGASQAGGWPPMHLLDLAKGTSTPATVVALPPEDLVTRCAEILRWQKTGILTGDALRNFAQKRWPDEYDSLQNAEKDTAREAFAYVLSVVAPKAETTAPAKDSSNGNQ